MFLQKNTVLLTDFINKSLIVRGGLTGLISALTGSVVFALLDITITRFRFGFSPNIKQDLIASFFVFIILTLAIGIYTFIPGLLGGGLLAFILRYDHLRGKLSKRVAALKGTLLGLLAGLMLCMYVYYTQLIAPPPLTHHMSSDAFLFHSAIALIVAPLAGGWTGGRLAGYIFENSMVYSVASNVIDER